MEDGTLVEDPAAAVKEDEEIKIDTEETDQFLLKAAASSPASPTTKKDRLTFGALEGSYPEQQYKKNVELDHNKERRPSDFGIQPLPLIEDSQRRN